jgi:hypothetical protein
MTFWFPKVKVDGMRPELTKFKKTKKFAVSDEYAVAPCE